MKYICLIMPESPSRTLAVTKHFAECGLDPVHLMPTINGDVFGLQTSREYTLDGPPFNGYRVPPKVVGIFLSHYTAWMACSLMDDDHFFIMEDDALFCTGWKERLDQVMKDVPPDFDMLYVGSCCCKDKPTEQVKGEVFVVEWPLCLHAYIIARKALPIFIRTQRNCYAPIDVALAIHTLPYMKAYTVLPRIVSQRYLDVPV